MREFLTLAPDISERSSSRCDRFAAGEGTGWAWEPLPHYCGIGGPLSGASAIRMIGKSPMTLV